MVQLMFPKLFNFAEKLETCVVNKGLYNSLLYLQKLEGLDDRFRNMEGLADFNQNIIVVDLASSKFFDFALQQRETITCLSFYKDLM